MRLLTSLFLFLALCAVSHADVTPIPNVPPVDPNEQPPASWSVHYSPDGVAFDDEFIFIAAKGFNNQPNPRIFTSALYWRNGEGQWEVIELWTTPIPAGFFDVQVSALGLLPIGEYMLMGSYSPNPNMFWVIERP